MKIILYKQSNYTPPKYLFSGYYHNISSFKEYNYNIYIKSGIIFNETRPSFSKVIDFFSFKWNEDREYLSELYYNTRLNCLAGSIILSKASISHIINTRDIKQPVWGWFKLGAEVITLLTDKDSKLISNLESMSDIEEFNLRNINQIK